MLTNKQAVFSKQYSPCFAWGGRPHRKFISVRERGEGWFSPVGAPQAKNFHFPPPAKADIATAILTHVIEHFVLLLPPNKHAVLYTFVARKPVENIMFDNASNSLISPTVENTAIYSVFDVPMPVAKSNIYIRNPCKTLCLTVFFQCFQSNRR